MLRNNGLVQCLSFAGGKPVRDHILVATLLSHYYTTLLVEVENLKVQRILMFIRSYFILPTTMVAWLVEDKEVR